MRYTSSDALHVHPRLRVADWSSQLHEGLFSELQVRSVHFSRVLILRRIDTGFRQATDFSNIGAKTGRVVVLRIVHHTLCRWGDGPVRSVMAGFSLQVPARSMLQNVNPLSCIQTITHAGVAALPHSKCSLLAPEFGSIVGG